MHRKRNSEMKCTAFSFGTFHPYRATHYFYKSFCNGKAQACTSKLAAGGSISLCELFKNDGQFVNRYAYTCIFYKEAYFHLTIRKYAEEFHTDEYLAMFCELDGITNEVHNYLAQAKAIANDS